MRFTTEAYYKRLTNVVPYDVDNVRVRYFGENIAKRMRPELNSGYLASW